MGQVRPTFPWPRVGAAPHHAVCTVPRCPPVTTGGLWWAVVVVLHCAPPLQMRAGYGVTGVPFFVVRSEGGGEGGAPQTPIGVSGAQDPDTLVQMIREVLGEQ